MFYIKKYPLLQVVITSVTRVVYVTDRAIKIATISVSTVAPSAGEIAEKLYTNFALSAAAFMPMACGSDILWCYKFTGSLQMI